MGGDGVQCEELWPGRWDDDGRDVEKYGLSTTQEYETFDMHEFLVQDIGLIPHTLRWWL